MQTFQEITYCHAIQSVIQSIGTGSRDAGATFRTPSHFSKLSQGVTCKILALRVGVRFQDFPEQSTGKGPPGTILENSPFNSHQGFTWKGSSRHLGRSISKCLSTRYNEIFLALGGGGPIAGVWPERGGGGDCRIRRTSDSCVLA